MVGKVESRRARNEKEATKRKKGDGKNGYVCNNESTKACNANVCRAFHAETDHYSS